MSATTTQNQRWLQKWLRFEPHQVIGDGSPYLLRWYVIPRNPVLNVYLHKFLRSDDDRALHDHPWWFVSLILRGGYTEVTENARTPRSGILGGRYLGWDRQIAFRSSTFRHRVELWPLGPLVRYWDKEFNYLGREPRRELPCWTLIVTGRRVRTWGFWCKGYTDQLDRIEVPDRFVPWQEWGDAGCGEN